MPPGREVLLLAGAIEGTDASWEPPFQNLFQIHRVTGCREALAAMNQGLPAVVLCAQQLRDGSWKDVAGAAAMMPRPPVLIVASRLADERLWSEVLNLGGYDLLATPFVEAELARSLWLAWEHWVNQRDGSAMATRTTLVRPQEVQICSEA